MKSYEDLEKNNNVIKLKIKNITVEIEYSKESKELKECMINILKRKNKI